MTKKRTDRTEMQAAKQVANETLRASAEAEWRARRQFMKESRGGDLQLPADTLVSYETQTQAIYARAVTVLDDIQCHDPDPDKRIKAADVLLRHKTDNARIKAELEARNPVVDEPPSRQLSAANDDVPWDEKVRILKAVVKAS